jgi:hypothetical protein
MFELGDRIAESVLAGADVVVEDGGEFVAEVLGDDLPELGLEAPARARRLGRDLRRLTADRDWT